ncbi:MAG: hypothetical protein MUF26_06880 [Syntrophales bacterium]|nr:hypothetical protein [Syntrophales bacterium]
MIASLVKSVAAFFTICLVCLLAACSNLPEIRPAVPGLQTGLRESCKMAFPAGPHRFVHSIEARLPDDSRAMTLGIVKLDPDKGVIHCVIMTIEGFVLFDARYQQTVTVDRAVYPFDSPEFAKSMMADIRLIFFPPKAVDLVFKAKLNGYQAKLNGYHRQHGWIIRQYDVSDHLSGQVKAGALNPEGIPEKIELSRNKYPGYTLTMTLLQAEYLPEGDESLK